MGTKCEERYKEMEQGISYDANKAKTFPPEELGILREVPKN